jgi:hypothetical protein
MTHDVWLLSDVINLLNAFSIRFLDESPPIHEIIGGFQGSMVFYMFGGLVFRDVFSDQCRIRSTIWPHCRALEMDRAACVLRDTPG